MPNEVGLVLVGTAEASSRASNRTDLSVFLRICARCYGSTGAPLQIRKFTE